MDGWDLQLSVALFCLVCIALGLMSADSRPGFGHLGRADRKERWFPHSRDD